MKPFSTIQGVPLVRAYQNGGIDGKDLRRAAKLLDDSNDEYLYDSDISTQELVKIDTKGGDLSKTGMVVKDSHDEVMWLESGNGEEGWIHIAARHLLGTNVADEGGTSFWPIIESSNGLTADELASEFHGHSDGGIGTFRRFTIDENTTRIGLADGDYLINADSDNYRPWTGSEVLDQSPTEDVFRIDVLYSDGPGSKSDYYQIVLWTYTDIWFEDSEIGNRNRERLATALSRLYETTDADGVELDSRFISERSLQQRGYSNLLPGSESE